MSDFSLGELFIFPLKTKYRGSSLITVSKDASTCNGIKPTFLNFASTSKKRSDSLIDTSISSTWLKTVILPFRLADLISLVRLYSIFENGGISMYLPILSLFKNCPTIFCSTISTAKLRFLKQR